MIAIWLATGVLAGSGATTPTTPGDFPVIYRRRRRRR